MTPATPSRLCTDVSCRRCDSHAGPHSPFANEAWRFFNKIDKRKLVKAGFATPRGGAKGGYQNHVVRSNQVIIPYERLPEVSLARYADGYVVRLLPDQYFETPGIPRAEFQDPASLLKIGINAFILYRTWEAYRRLPPLPSWELRTLVRGRTVVPTRGPQVADAGHYILRLPPLGPDPAKDEGPPQGLFAPEYADSNTNFLCQCVLAWLIIQTVGSPYTVSQAGHLRAILEREGLDDVAEYENRGALRRGLTQCPLCMRFLRYQELHKTVSFEESEGLRNAPQQVPGATRSTVVSLFHLDPLTYSTLAHIPKSVAWGHAVCNTRLGQRRCYSLQQLIARDLKVAIVRPEGIETFGWISEDREMIRSPGGAVWIQLNDDTAEEVPAESARSVTGDEPSDEGIEDVDEGSG